MHVIQFTGRYSDEFEDELKKHRIEVFDQITHMQLYGRIVSYIPHVH